MGIMILVISSAMIEIIIEWGIRAGIRVVLMRIIAIRMGRAISAISFIAMGDAMSGYIGIVSVIIIADILR